MTNSPWRRDAIHRVRQIVVYQNITINFVHGMTEAETFIKDCLGFRATGAGGQTFLSLRSKDNSVETRQSDFRHEISNR